MSRVIPVQILLAYGLPGLPLAVLGLPLFIYLPTFYAETIGLDLATVGGVFLLARLWDGMTDPLIGVLSDRTTASFGRRRLWILASLPLLCLSVDQLFAPPDGIGVIHLMLWSILLYSAWTMFQLPHAAWGAELSSDYHERSRLTGVRETLVVIGTLLATVVPVLLGQDTTGMSNLREVLSVLALGLIIALPISGGLACVCVPDPPIRRQPLVPWRGRLSQACQALTNNQAFRRLMPAYFLNGIANGLPATLFLLYVGHVLALPGEAGGLLLVYFVCAIVGVPFWVWVSGRISKHRAWIISMFLTCLVFSGAPFLGSGDYVPFLLICVMSGFCLGADLALPPSMQADVVDLDPTETGVRRTGLYFALWGMATKLALALAVGISFPLLDLVGFDAADGAVNEEGGLLALALLYGALPIVFKIAAIALMARFGELIPMGSDHHSPGSH